VVTRLATDVEPGPEGPVERNIADTPVPYRLTEFIRILDQGMGKLDKPDTAVPDLRLLARLDALNSDKRFAFMFSGILVRDTLPPCSPDEVAKKTTSPESRKKQDFIPVYGCDCLHKSLIRKYFITIKLGAQGAKAATTQRLYNTGLWLSWMSNEPSLGLETPGFPRHIATTAWIL
jgi:hypothetical protein